MANVEPYRDDLFRFLVKSRKDPDAPPHLVDIVEYDCNGWCDCNDFKFKHQANILKGVRPSRCWHINEARKFPIGDYLPKLAAYLKQNFNSDDTSKTHKTTDQQKSD